MPPRRRILQVSLDDKTLTGLVNQLSKRLHHPDELEGIARVSRGGLAFAFVDAFNFVSATDIHVVPVLPGVPNRRIQMLGYTMGRIANVGNSAAWLVETSIDFVESNTMLAAWTKTPRDIVESNPTDAEGKKFVRTLGWIPQFQQGGYVPTPGQIGLLDPGHGIGIIAGGAGGITDRYQGTLNYRELLANIT